MRKFNLYRIFDDLFVKVALVDTSTQFHTPTIVYILMNPIGYKKSII